jgi:hypothetical protein
MKNILITLVTLIGFILPQDCEEPSEIWFKISNDATSKDYGELIQIDMSWGYAGTDGIYVYLFVYEKDTRKELVIQFPIGYWESEKIDKSKKYIPKENEEFDLKEYLKRNKGNGIKITNKVGD